MKPSQIKITFPIKLALKAELFIKGNSDWEKIKDINDVAIQDIFEIGIPFEDLKVKENDEINLFISIMKNSEEMERCPWRGFITFTVPTPDFEAMMWY